MCESQSLGCCYGCKVTGKNKLLIKCIDDNMEKILIVKKYIRSHIDVKKNAAFFSYSSNAW